MLSYDAITDPQGQLMMRVTHFLNAPLTNTPQGILSQKGFMEVARKVLLAHGSADESPEVLAIVRLQKALNDLVQRPFDTEGSFQVLRETPVAFLGVRDKLEQANETDRTDRQFMDMLANDVPRFILNLEDSLSPFCGSILSHEQRDTLEVGDSAAIEPAPGEGFSMRGSLQEIINTHVIEYKDHKMSILDGLSIMQESIKNAQVSARYIFAQVTPANAGKMAALTQLDERFDRLMLAVGVLSGIHDDPIDFRIMEDFRNWPKTFKDYRQVMETLYDAGEKLSENPASIAQQKQDVLALADIVTSHMTNLYCGSLGLAGTPGHA